MNSKVSATIIGVVLLAAVWGILAARPQGATSTTGTESHRSTDTTQVVSANIYSTGCLGWAASVHCSDYGFSDGISVQASNPCAMSVGDTVSFHWQPQVKMVVMDNPAGCDVVGTVTPGNYTGYTG